MRVLMLSLPDRTQWAALNCIAIDFASISRTIAALKP